VKLPSVSRINKNDYPEDSKQLVEKLADTINPNTEMLYELANKKTSLRDNMLCTVRDFTVSVDANGVPLTRTSVALDTPGKVDGVSVIRVTNATNANTYPNSQPYVGFTPQASAINIDVVKGLSVGSQWTIRIIIWQA